MIESLSEHPKFGSVVVQWLQTEWEIAEREILSFLSPTADRPGAIVAIQDDTPIGTLAFKRHQSSFQSSPQLWINAVYVEPDYRRRGIGRSLVRHSVDICAQRGIGQLFAYTDVPKLYLGVGWTNLFVSPETAMSTLVWHTSS